MNLKKSYDLNTVYSIQVIRLNLRIAIAFCIADYKEMWSDAKLCLAG
jgi:hypothetical protein